MPRRGGERQVGVSTHGAPHADSASISANMFRSFQPCLPTRVMKAPTGERWIHEIKHDGFRLIARRVGVTVKLYTRGDAIGRSAIP